MSFGTTDISGVIEVARVEGHLDTASAPSARITLPLAGLTSGNALYDAELQQRLEAQRYPAVTLELVEARQVAGTNYQIEGSVTLHGQTSTLRGGVALSFPDDDAILVTGEQVVDIRDFHIDLPSVLMLRIYPDVTVRLHLLARALRTTETEI